MFYFIRVFRRRFVACIVTQVYSYQPPRHYRRAASFILQRVKIIGRNYIMHDITLPYNLFSFKR